MTECFKYLLAKNKHKGHISKRTVKKVVFRQCPNLLLRALAVLQNPNNQKKDDKVHNQESRSDDKVERYLDYPRQNSNSITTGATRSADVSRPYTIDSDQPRKLGKSTSTLSMCRQLEVKLMFERL
jgi:hypothetical protein